MVKVGENLILRATRSENGKPVEALVILKLNGETMNMIQELEGSVMYQARVWRRGSRQLHSCAWSGWPDGALFQDHKPTAERLEKRVCGLPEQRRRWSPCRVRRGGRTEEECKAAGLDKRLERHGCRAFRA